MFAGYRAILAEPRSKTNSAEGEYAAGGGGGGGGGARFDQHGCDNMNPYPFAPMGGEHGTGVPFVSVLLWSQGIGLYLKV